MPNQPPLAPGVEVCPECEKGFPIEEGEHYGTQSLGMIPTTRCRALPPAPEQKPCELCCGHDAQKFSDGSCAMRVGLGFCRHRCPAAPEPAPQPPCDCAIRADGIGAMHGHHDEQCPRYAAPQPASDESEPICVGCHLPVGLHGFDIRDSLGCELAKLRACVRVADRPAGEQQVLDNVVLDEIEARMKAERLRWYPTKHQAFDDIETLIAAIRTSWPAAPPHDWARVVAERVGRELPCAVPFGFTDRIAAFIAEIAASEQTLSAIHSHEAINDLLQVCRMAFQQIEFLTGRRKRGWDQKFIEDRFAEAEANLRSLSGVAAPQGDFRAGVAACVEKVKAAYSYHQPKNCQDYEFGYDAAKEVAIDALDDCLTDSAPAQREVDSSGLLAEINSYFCWRTSDGDANGFHHDFPDRAIKLIQQLCTRARTSGVAEKEK